MPPAVIRRVFHSQGEDGENQDYLCWVLGQIEGTSSICPMRTANCWRGCWASSCTMSSQSELFGASNS